MHIIFLFENVIQAINILLAHIHPMSNMGLYDSDAFCENVILNILLYSSFCLNISEGWSLSKLCFIKTCKYFRV